MTLNDVIVKVDDIKPNAFTNETKTGWINEIEGLVQTEVMLLAPEEVIEYRYERNADTELLAKPPHVKIYWAYLVAMIDFANGEYDKYENTMEVFNTFFLEYQAWYARTYRPADGEMVLRGYYLSAYGLAVKHGFAGTEEEWIESIRGMPGDPGPGVNMRFENGWIQWKRENSAVWNELLSLADIQGEVISQTLEAAEDANQQAQTTLEAAHSMEAEVELAKTAAVQAAEQTASDRQAAEQANTEAQTARDAAQQAAAETEADRQAVAQDKSEVYAAKTETEQTAAGLKESLQTVEQTAAEVEADRQATEQAAEDVKADRQAAEQARADTEALKDETAAAAQAAQADRQAAEQAKAETERLEDSARSSAQTAEQIMTDTGALKDQTETILEEVKLSEAQMQGYAQTTEENASAAQTAQAAAEAAKRAAEQARNEAQGIVGGQFLPMAGGTMTGPIILSGEPTADLHAVPKQYVDDLVGDIGSILDSLNGEVV